MKITLNRVNENFHFELKNDRGHIVNVDARPDFGGNDMGPSPMELVLMGVAGCSAIDMISILTKAIQQQQEQIEKLTRVTPSTDKTSNAELMMEIKPGSAVFELMSEENKITSLNAGEIE